MFSQGLTLERFGLRRALFRLGYHFYFEYHRPES